MDNISAEMIQIGGVFILAYLIIKDIVVPLIKGVLGKKNGNYNQEVLEQVKILNQNHLNTIDKSLNDGFDRIVNELNNGNKQIIQLLGEIKGAISKIK